MRIGEYRIKHLEEVASETDRTQNIHVTDLSRCLGGVWQEKTGRAKSDINESKLRRFDAGHNIEERVIVALKAAGVLVDTQTRVVWPEYNMVGSADAIILEDDQYWLVEVKSIHVYGMKYLYESQSVAEKYPHYYEQIQLYLSKLRVEYPGMRAKIYFECLDGRTYEEEIEYDPSIVGAALKRAETLFRAIEADKMPGLPDAYVFEDDKWKLNWRVEYCYTAGLHHKCDPDAVLDPDPIKQVSKMKYQMTKRNKK